MHCTASQTYECQLTWAIPDTSISSLTWGRRLKEEISITRIQYNFSQQETSSHQTSRQAFAFGEEQILGFSKAFIELCSRDNTTSQSPRARFARVQPGVFGILTKFIVNNKKEK
jgi:hypothetical protein